MSDILRWFPSLAYEMAGIEFERALPVESDHLAVFTIPVRTGRGLNDRLTWRARAAKVKAHRTAAYLMGKKRLQGSTVVLPLRVTLCRLSAGELDGDNLQGALKAIRDGLADALGVKDNDPRVTWEYIQAKVKRGNFGVRVTVEGF
jgi:hypothetical protein